MKIHEYYRDSAKVNLNGSLASLFPAILIVASNLAFFHRKEMMLLSFPFLLYSIISFQFYLYRINQFISVGNIIGKSTGTNESLLDAKNFLVEYMNTQDPTLFLYFPNGNLAGKLKKLSSKNPFKRTKTYVLSSSISEVIGIYKVTRSHEIKVYNNQQKYLGCFKKTKQGLINKGKKEILNASGRCIAAVEGASFLMDERIFNQKEELIGRMQRGWMPMEWSRFFPDPNTPVLSFFKLANEDKILGMSLLIHEFFIER